MNGISFRNKTASNLRLWIEPYCIELELDSEYEYRIEVEETELWIDILDGTIEIYLDEVFGPKVFKRLYLANRFEQAEWDLIEDYSDFKC